MFLAMMAYLTLVLIRPQDYPAFVDSAAAPLQPVVLIVAALFWLVSVRKSFEAPQYLLLLLFFITLMLSNIANGWYGGALVQIGKFAPVLLAFVVLANAADTRARVVMAMAVFALCAGVLALHGIDQAQTGVGWTGVGLSQGTRIQYVGIFNDPNDLGMLFVTCLPMAFYLSSRGGMMGLRRLFWLAVAAMLLYGIYLTNSRGTLLALLAMLAVYVWQRRGLLTAGVMGAAGLGVLLLLPSRLQGGLEITEESALGRVDSWYEGLQMFRANPVFGVGADAYTDVYRLTAHNSFVLVLAETGIVGFTLWIAFIGYCFRMMLVAIKPPQGITAGALDPGQMPDDIDPEVEVEADQWYEDRAVAVTLLLSLSSFFTAAFFLSRSYVVLLYLLTALVVAHYTRMRERDPALPAFGLQHDLLRWPLWSLAGVVGLYLLVKVLLSSA